MVKRSIQMVLVLNIQTKRKTN
uniref:NADH-plastoquinone oxidoreductase subunit K n=1 Tax=Santalum album TaxID=35974 RepID=A0A6M8AXC8_SANAL|nr:NADH-plastoquinone oxidoreductase subunit K [Santalum album]